MVDPSLTISIDRTSLSLGPLVLTGEASAEYGIVAYSPPARISQVEYMPDSPFVQGSEAIGSRLLQAVLSFSWMRCNATSETQVQAAYEAMAAALGQFSFEVTTQVSGAPEQVWRADPGSMQLGSPSGRTYIDLATRTPVYSVTIPVHPIPSLPEES